MGGEKQWKSWSVRINQVLLLILMCVTFIGSPEAKTKAQSPKSLDRALSRLIKRHTQDLLKHPALYNRNEPKSVVMAEVIVPPTSGWYAPTVTDRALMSYLDHLPLLIKNQDIKADMSMEIHLISYSRGDALKRQAVFLDAESVLQSQIDWIDVKSKSGKSTSKKLKMTTEITDWNSNKVFGLIETIQ